MFNRFDGPHFPFSAFEPAPYTVTRLPVPSTGIMRHCAQELTQKLNNLQSQSGMSALPEHPPQTLAFLICFCWKLKHYPDYDELIDSIAQAYETLAKAKDESLPVKAEKDAVSHFTAWVATSEKSRKDMNSLAANLCLEIIRQQKVFDSEKIQEALEFAKNQETDISLEEEKPELPHFLRSAQGEEEKASRGSTASTSSVWRHQTETHHSSTSYEEEEPETNPQTGDIASPPPFLG